ncbi:MAG: hypothetical protein QOI41_7632, partial [Myxococcales bacterium]|nr:hypothetical protein [Myxococcales bacterium]
ALHADPFWRFASAKAMIDGLELALAPAAKRVKGAVTAVTAVAMPEAA